MHCIRQYIQNTYPHLPNLLLTAGPTGTAACGIFGITLHSMFNLPIATKKGKDPAPPLQGASLANLQTKMEGCKILVIDEFSMISGRLIYMICRRCQEAFPEFALHYFGNLIIILLGKLNATLGILLFHHTNLISNSKGIQRNCLQLKQSP